MTGRAAALLTLALLAPSGCASGEAEDEGAEPDCRLVEALAELHLADARAETTGQNRDSLRAVALDARGLDSSALARALDALARRPQDAEALYETLAARLAEEQSGVRQARGRRRAEDGG